MSIEAALRATELLLALALMQSSAEHLATPRERALYAPRVMLCVLLASGIASALAALALFAHSLLLLHRYQGAYNGGSDKMGLLAVFCLCLAQIAPELGLGYLALQLILSYVISGWAKIVNPEWRSGQALEDVFAYSAYPVAGNIAALARHPRLLFLGSWAVILLELAFPLALLSTHALIVALVLTAAFHLANAVLFGLNRFLWVWLSTYPALLWFQAWLAQGKSTILP